MSEVITFIYDTIDQGRRTGISRPLAEIVTNKKAWKKFWSAHTAGRVPKSKEPEIDFKKNFVAVVVGEQYSSNSGDLWISSIRSNGADGVVTYCESSEPGAAMVMSRPYHFVRFARGPIKFRIEKSLKVESNFVEPCR